MVPEVNIEPRHCPQCGSKDEVVGPYVSGYNIKTGEPVYEIKLRCPNYRWWKEMLVYHTNVRMQQNTDGTWY